MPITYSDVTYIQNGQAINADVLNAPSVDLDSRTMEIKRDSDQERFSQEHTADVEVVLVSSSSQDSSVVIRSELKADGSADANLVKYYLPSFNNIAFSLYSRAVPGGRYVIPGSSIAALWGDSVNGTNSVYSLGLTVPGDGYYAKVPLRYTGTTETLTNYPDLVYPKTRDQSLGEGYLSSGLTAEVVKLPELGIMDLLGASSVEGVDTFTARLEAQFSDIDSVTVSEEGRLEILDANQLPLSIRLAGTSEGADCEISHILPRDDDDPGVLLKFSRASSPIYPEHSTRISVTNLEVVLYRDSTELDSSRVPVSSDNYSGYYIVPDSLDPNYSYIPLVKLTENSLLLGNRVQVPLDTRVLPNGAVVNKHGSPVYGVTPDLSTEDAEEYSVDIFKGGQVDLEYKRSYLIDLGDISVDPDLLYIDSGALTPPDLGYLTRALNVGDRVFIKGVYIFVTEDLVSSWADPEWAISSNVYIDGVSRTSIFSTGYSPTVGDTIELTFSTPITIAAPVSNFTVGFQALADSNTGGVLSGSLSAKLDIMVL